MSCGDILTGRPWSLLETSSGGRAVCMLAGTVQRRLKLSCEEGVKAGCGGCQTPVLRREIACRRSQARVKSIRRVLSNICDEQKQPWANCALQTGQRRQAPACRR